MKSAFDRVFDTRCVNGTMEEEAIDSSSREDNNLAAQTKLQYGAINIYKLKILSLKFRTSKEQLRFCQIFSILASISTQNQNSPLNLNVISIKRHSSYLYDRTNLMFIIPNCQQLEFIQICRISCRIDLSLNKSINVISLVQTSPNTMVFNNKDGLTNKSNYKEKHGFWGTKYSMARIGDGYEKYTHCDVNCMYLELVSQPIPYRNIAQSFKKSVNIYPKYFYYFSITKRYHRGNINVAEKFDTSYHRNMSCLVMFVTMASVLNYQCF